MTTAQHHQADTMTAERRSEPRTRTILSVVLRAPETHPMEACVLDISPGGARLRVPEPVAIGADIKIEADDLLLFGTVTRCGQVHGAHEVGIALTFPLQMLKELKKLNDALHESAGE